MFSPLEQRLRNKGYYAIATVVRARNASKTNKSTARQNALISEACGLLYAISDSGLNATLDLNIDLSGLEQVFRDKIRYSNRREHPSTLLFVARQYAHYNPDGTPDYLMKRIENIRNHNVGAWRDYASKTYDYCAKRNAVKAR